MTGATGSEFLELEENVQIDGRSWLRIPLQASLAAATIVLTAAGLFYANCPAGLAAPVAFVVGVTASYEAAQRLIPMRAARKVLLSRDEVRLISLDGSLLSPPNRAAQALVTSNPNDLRVALDGQELVTMDRSSRSRIAPGVETAANPSAPRHCQPAPCAGRSGRA